jgi:hypothetical protein
LFNKIETYNFIIFITNKYSAPFSNKFKNNITKKNKDLAK